MIGVGKEYWENEWNKRIVRDDCGKGKNVSRNIKKFAKLFYELSKKEHLFGIEKLDVGCGPSMLAVFMGMFAGVKFTETYTGIDLSKKAVDWCTDVGVNAVQGDILDYPFKKKFGCFMFWDVLEHIADHWQLAERVKELAENEFYLIGNIPLYTSEHPNREGGYERPMNIDELLRFIKFCGGIGFEQEIYGAFGRPYMFFEAKINK